MQTRATIEAIDSPVPGVVPDEAGAAHQRRGATPPATGAAKPAPSSRRRNPARSMLAKLMGAIRGDKYMADAYPPAWRSAGDASTAAHVDRQDHDGNVRAATQARLDADRWIDEGGSLGSETTRPSRAAAAGHEQWSA